MIYKALDEYSKRDLNPHSHYWPKDFKSFVSTIPPFEHPQKRRAENETRTRDPNLGKVMLYQLSYFRRFLENGCKDKQFSRFCQIFFYKSTVLAAGLEPAEPFTCPATLSLQLAWSQN